VGNEVVGEEKLKEMFEYVERMEENRGREDMKVVLD
jgi:hypothetical protein